MKEEKIVPVFPNGTTFNWERVPNKQEFLIADTEEYTLYITDWEKGILKEIIDHHTLKEEYQEKVEQWEKDHSQPFPWASGTIINPTGSHILFYTYRELLFQEELESFPSILYWVKNVETNEEYPTKYPGVISSVVGWSDEHETIIQSVTDIISLNVETGDYTVLAEEVNEAVLANQQLIYQKENGTLILHDVTTGSEREINESFIQQLSHFKYDGNWIGFMNRNPEEIFIREILLFNVEKNEWRLLKAPAHLVFDNFSFTEGDILLVNAHEQDHQQNEYTYFIPINDIEIID